MVERVDWQGLLTGQRSDDADIGLVMPIRSTNGGGSRPFLGVASDEKEYWIKPLNNPQGARVPINEQVVGRLGRALRAPTCPVKRIRITGAAVGWNGGGPYSLEEGIAHASLAENGVTEIRTMQHRTDDDNRRRHAFLLALIDLCWGGDTQWLVKAAEENQYVSHDHGHYFPNGPNWQQGHLFQVVDEPHDVGGAWEHIDAAVVHEVADQIETALDRPTLIDVLAGIPGSWPVADDELECLGYFLERRGAQVVARLRARFGA